MKHERRGRATRAGQTSEEGKERAREIVRVLSKCAAKKKKAGRMD